MADVTDTFYPAADAVQGYGAQFLIGDGGTPEVFTAVFGVLSVVPGKASSADVDTTHLRSPDRHREHRQGMLDHGLITVKGIYSPSHESHKDAGGGTTGAFMTLGVPGMVRDGKVRNIQVIANDGNPLATPTPIEPTTWTIPVYVSSWSTDEITTDSVIKFTAEFMPVRSYPEP